VDKASVPKKPSSTRPSVSIEYRPVSGHIHTADTLGLHALGDKLAGGETITYALAHRGGSGSLAIIAARLAGPGGTDSQTDGRIAASLNAPLRRGGA